MPHARFVLQSHDSRLEAMQARASEVLVHAVGPYRGRLQRVLRCSSKSKPSTPDHHPFSRSRSILSIAQCPLSTMFACITLLVQMHTRPSKLPVLQLWWALKARTDNCFRVHNAYTAVRFFSLVLLSYFPNYLSSNTSRESARLLLLQNIL